MATQEFTELRRWGASLREARLHLSLQVVSLHKVEKVRTGFPEFEHVPIPHRAADGVDQAQVDELLRRQRQGWRSGTDHGVAPGRGSDAFGTAHHAA